MHAMWALNDMVRKISSAESVVMVEWSGWFPEERTVGWGWKCFSLLRIIVEKFHWGKVSILECAVLLELNWDDQDEVSSHRTNSIRVHLWIWSDRDVEEVHRDHLNVMYPPVDFFSAMATANYGQENDKFSQMMNKE